MRTVLGVICVLFGGFGWIGQFISAVNYELAQKLGLQEKDEGTGPLYRRAETNAARWDSVVLWTMAVAGVLMLMDHTWWPYVGLIAGGIYLDGAGREAAKCISMYKEGVRVGTPKDHKVAATFFVLMAGIALWLIIYALCELTARAS